MVSPIHILSLDQEGEEGVIVTFSEGTTGGYVIGELLHLRRLGESENERKPRNVNALQQINRPVDNWSGSMSLPNLSFSRDSRFGLTDRLTLHRQPGLCV